MPQQGGGYNMHPSFGGFMNDPTAQLGFQMGKTAMDAGQQYVEQNVCINSLWELVFLQRTLAS
jgi:hypothetical protein